MNISVVLSTYNSPEWLEKVIWGYYNQTHKNFELIIADDGSTDQTAELIQHLRQQTNLDIKHVWHPDQGFRKCRILNKAITQTQYDYILFSDGDCIPRKDFVAVHAAEAKAGYYLSGSYFKLPMNISQRIGKDDIFSGQCFDVKWLQQQGLGFWRKTHKISLSPGAAKLANRLTPTQCNLKGSNASAWKKDILAVNGFDERMPWGGEDREFGVRLINSGIKPKHVRYNAIVIHLDHARGYVDQAQVKANKALRLYNEQHKIKTTDHGIRQSVAQKPGADQR
ncbi:MAG TPA: glycosyltransferase family 2 protein [Cellvibrionaceae bacterium]